jgi:hypothetical protein
VLDRRDESSVEVLKLGGERGGSEEGFGGLGGGVETSSDRS